MMNKDKRILLTGAAGFIGSYLLGYLNKLGYRNIIIVDDFTDEDKWFNFDSKKFAASIEREVLFDWMASPEVLPVDIVFHLGARTDTTEFDYSVHEKLNVQYSKKIWDYCIANNIPLIYASSAATYGGGEKGYKDDHALVNELVPLNPYGVSKNEFDKWTIAHSDEGVAPPFWAGLKFFNVYGPNEYHKGRMASMVFHGFNQVKKTGSIRLFRSHRTDFKDGEQLRDFIHVEDVARVCVWLMDSIENGTIASGLYNLGTGKARSFVDLISPIFLALNKPVNIEFVDTPEDIRDKYQYFTEADMHKLRAAGYTEEFIPVEKGVEDYVKNFLLPKNYY
jgi:ADP-L-glycero-D-manno-heptose 6-epimerase